jgi:hypothetical protein
LPTSSARQGDAPRLIRTISISHPSSSTPQAPRAGPRECSSPSTACCG